MKTLPPYSLHVGGLRHAEIGAFVDRIITDFTDLRLSTATEPDFVLLFNYLVNLLPEYKKALKQILAAAESKLLAEQDRIRDNRFITLHSAMKLHKNTGNAAKKTAFNLLKILFNTNKNITRENYETESLSLTLFIAKLRTAEYFAAITLLGMTEHLDNLEAANNSFKATFSARSKDTNTTEVYDTIKMRKEIEARYKNWSNYIHSLQASKDSAFFDAVCTMNNNIRRYFATILANRKGDDDDDATEELPTT